MSWNIIDTTKSSLHGVSLQPSSFNIALSPMQVNLHALQRTPLLQPRRPSVAQGCSDDGHQLVDLCIKGILRYDAIGDVNRECLQWLQGFRNVSKESEKEYLSKCIVQIHICMYMIRTYILYIYMYIYYM